MAVPNDKRDYVRASLGVATAQICQSLGWHSVQKSSHDVLTDVLERYINLVSKRAALISQTCKYNCFSKDAQKLQLTDFSCSFNHSVEKILLF